MTLREKLIHKIENEKLTDRQLEEVYDFIGFLEQKVDQANFSKLSEKSLEKIWLNEEDATYDKYVL